MFDNILIGADPELFLKNPNSGMFVSGHGMIKGTKDEPFKVDRGAVQVDGTALEFNIDPCATEDQFCTNIRDVRAQLSAMVSGYALVAEPVADFDPEYFHKGIPDSAKALGCDPDYNAWAMCANDVPDATRTFRTGSGHIHVGWGHGFDVNDPDHFTRCADVVKQLDYYVGVHSLLWDPDARRRELYGKAGAFRPKVYGVEYRTLSNRWLSSELLTRWVYRATRRAMKDFADGVRMVDSYGDLARTIIDDNCTDWKSWNVVEIPNFAPPPKAA